MDPEVEARFDRWEREHESAMRRMDRLDRSWESRHKEAMERMDRAEQRMDKFDRSLGGVKKLLIEGAKTIVELREDRKQAKAEMRELKALVKSFLNRRGSNGHGRLN